MADKNHITPGPTASAKATAVRRSFTRRRKSRTRPTLPAFVALGFVAALSAAPAQQQQKFAGVITDDMCAKGDHSGMRMGPNDAECTKACVALHNADYVLYDGTSTYVLSDQKLPEKFAGQKVTVLGTLDAKTKTLKVESITTAK
jgi:hypothetical protein